MTDYIKREDAIEYLVNNMAWMDEDGIETSEEDKRDAITELINGVPSADVAPVVRCKDCKWHQDNATWEDFINHCKWISTETPDENDFCSCGERKDNE